MVQETDERIGKGFCGFAGGTWRPAIPRPRGDDKPVSQTKKEVFMSNWRVAVGMPPIEHEHRWTLTNNTVFNWPLLQLSNAAYRPSPAGVYVFLAYYHANKERLPRLPG